MPDFTSVGTYPVLLYITKFY